MSSATLASISVGDLTVAGITLQGHDVSVASLSAVAQTLSQDAPAVSFVPITLDGVKKGAVTVTPANSPQSVAAVTTGVLPLNVLSASSPTAQLTAAKAATGAVSGLTASLGEASILGMPLSLKGGVNVGSAADNAKAQAGKTLTITDVSLPNISDLLAALGIDVTTLPVDTLNGLVDSLSLAVSSAAQTALDGANAAIAAADDAHEAAQAALATAMTDLEAKAATLDAQLATVTIPPAPAPQPPAGIEAPLTHEDWDALSSTAAGQAAQTAIMTANAANAAFTTAVSQYVAAKSAVGTAEAAVNTALAAIQPLIDDLAGVVDGILALNPLVSVDAASIGTKALTGATKSAEVTGYISGVKVLGQDVLATVTGNTKLDAVALTSAVTAELNKALATATGALSTVLSAATGATGLVVPAPVVKVLTKETKTGTDGVFGTADVLVTALQVDLGSASVPEKFALANAPELPAMLPTATGFKTAPLSIKVGQLGEAARFRPASTTPGSTPTKPGTGSLPSTGGPVGLAAIAVIGTALAFGARRMARSES